MHFKRRLAACATALFVLGGVAGVRTVDRASASTPDDSTKPEVGGEITYLASQEPNSYVPWATTTAFHTGGQWLHLVFGALLDEDPQGALQPGFAESLDPNDDGTTWTLSLRDGVTFSDETPFDAEAVSFTLQHYIDETGPSQGVASQIADLVVIDPLTLEIHLSAPNTVFDTIVAEHLNWVVSPTAFEAAGADEFGAAPVGAGPFVLDEWRRGDRVVYQRNPTFWDAPRPYADQLTVQFIPDEQQRLNSMTAGQANLATIQLGANLVLAREGGLQAHATYPSGGSCLAMNTRQPPFDDVRVRQAVSMAVDPERFNEIVLAGEGQVADTWFKPDHPLYTDTPLSRFDPDAAQELFDEYAAETGGPVQFTLVSNNSTFNQTTAEFFQTELLAFDNVVVEVELLDVNEQIQRAISGDFGATVWAAQGNNPEPVMPSRFASTGTANAMGYSNPEVDEIFAEAISADADTRRDLYQRLSEILAEEQPCFYYARQLVSGVASADLHGLEDAFSLVFRADRLWLEQ